MTHSPPIFSDAAESVIHVIAVALPASVFVSASSRLRTLPLWLRAHHLLLRGFEGALIVVAAIAILVESIREWIAGLQLTAPRFRCCAHPHRRHPEAGLGYYLIRAGKRTNSLILEAKRQSTC